VVTVPLIVLAFLSVTAGFLNVPEAMGGNAAFHHWLEPVFAAQSADPHAHAVEHHDGAEAHTAHHDPVLELGLALFSLLVAGTGISVGWFLYVKRKDLPAVIAASIPGLRELSFNKFYVDEIYQAVFVDNFMKLSRFIAGFDSYIIDDFVNGIAHFGQAVARLTGWFDRVFVDGAVVGVGTVTAWTGKLTNRLQTGYLYNYIAYAVGGALAIAAVLLWTL
jgi:NADH-quinone oxidoreductase subunit L